MKNFTKDFLANCEDINQFLTTDIIGFKEYIDIEQEFKGFNLILARFAFGKILNETFLENNHIDNLSSRGQVEITNDGTDFDERVKNSDFLEDVLIKIDGNKHNYNYNSSTSITDNSFSYLSYCLFYKHSIKTLNLEANNISKEGFKYLKLFIHKLTSFKISQIKLDLGAMNAVCLNFKYCNSSLKILSLNRVALTLETIEVLTKSLVNLGSLEELNLEKSNIDDDMIKLLTRSLKKMPNLKFLNLDFNYLKQLFQSFQSYIEDCALRKLSLINNPLKEESFKFLKKGLMINQTITHLYIKETLNLVKKKKV